MTKKEEKTLNIHQRILAVMAEVDYVVKEKRKVNNQYCFVSHDAVTAALHPQLVKHGICMTSTCDYIKQDGNRTEVMMNFLLVNADNPSDFIECRFPGYGIDPQDKGVGKAISYAVKYFLLKTFCLETGDDVERDSINHQEQTISEDQASEIELMCADRPDLLKVVLTKCPKGELTNFPVARHPAMIQWLRNELNKIER